MCSFPPPPALTLLWPWQAPANWLVVTIFALAVLAAEVWLVAHARFQSPEGQWYVKLICALTAGALYVGAACVALLMLSPWYGALGAWHERQATVLAGHACPTAPLLSAWQHASTGAVAPILLMCALLAVSLALDVGARWRRLPWNVPAS